MCKICLPGLFLFFFCNPRGAGLHWLFNFHTFGQSKQPSKQVSLVSRDEILVLTDSLRDKGTTQEHRNKETTQEQRDNTGTKEQRNKGKKEQKNQGTKQTKEQRNLGAW